MTIAHQGVPNIFASHVRTQLHRYKVQPKWNWNVQHVRLFYQAVGYIPLAKLRRCTPIYLSKQGLKRITK